MATISARLLRDGPIEMIVKNIKRFIDVLGRDHNVVILMANVPADTPSRHIHAAVSCSTYLWSAAPGWRSRHKSISDT